VAITNTYKLFSKLVINLASAVLRVKMKLNQTKENNPGNVLTNSKEPLRVYGNPPSKTKQNLGLALFAGFGIGVALD
jgi:formate-dependent phosphoribosylglycinamide formyltransferase (GAR transformylase)